MAVVPAAGSGQRLGAGVPKALVPVAGRSMVQRAVAGLRDSGVVDAVVVVSPPQSVDAVTMLVGDVAAVVVGGADRVSSVARGLAEVPDEARVVLVHDAARCLCPPDVVRGVVEAVHAGHPAVVPTIPVADTVRRVDAEGRVLGLVDRAGLLAVQTPQGFDAGLLRRAHAVVAASSSGSPATDDAGLVEALGESVVTVPGDPRAFKITSALDLAMAEALLEVGS